MKMICPHCGVSGTAEDSLWDRKVKCPKCNGLFIADMSNMVEGKQFPVDNSDGMMAGAGDAGTDYLTDSDEMLDESEIDKILSGDVVEDEEITEHVDDVLTVVEESVDTENLDIVESDELLADTVTPVSGSAVEDKNDQFPDVDVDESLSGMDSFFDDDLPAEGTTDEPSAEEDEQFTGDSDIPEKEHGIDSSFDEDFGIEAKDETEHDSADNGEENDEDDGFATTALDDLWSNDSEVTEDEDTSEDADVPVKCAACGEYFQRGTGYKLGTTLYCDRCVPRKDEFGQAGTDESGEELAEEAGRKKGFLSRLFSRKK